MISTLNEEMKDRVVHLSQWIEWNINISLRSDFFYPTIKRRY